MKQIEGRAPAHRIRVCVGAFVFCAALTGCDKPPGLPGGDRVIAIDGDTVKLDAGVTLHDVDVRATGDTDFSQARLSVATGDVVRFTAADMRMHGLVINAPTAGAAATLAATGQQRSPPLVERGQAWIVSLADLPPGRYGVTCISHAGTLVLDIQ